MTNKTWSETWIFVDVDGVLNVGIRDEGKGSLEFCEENVRKAKLWRAYNPEAREDHPNDMERLSELVCAVADQPLQGSEKVTYSSHIACSTTKLNSIFVERLANLIRAAGSGVQVILSSSWRKPKFASRVLHLETMIGRILGRTFKFDAGTSLEKKSHRREAPADRLSCIGDFIAENTAEVSKFAEAQAMTCNLKVLILEDFFASPLNGFMCDTKVVCRCGDAEDYIQSRCASSGITMETRLLHTFHKFETPTTTVQIGSGLTDVSYRRGLEFVKEVEPEIMESDFQEGPTLMHSRLSGSSCKDGIKLCKSEGSSYPWTRFFCWRNTS